MIRFADLLIDSPSPLEDLAGQLAEAARGRARATDDPSVWELRFEDGRAARLADRQPDGAGELLFARYRYAVSAQLAPDATLAGSPEVRALRVLAHAAPASAGMHTLLVLDVQNRPVPPRAGHGAG